MLQLCVNTHFLHQQIKKWLIKEHEIGGKKREKKNSKYIEYNNAAVDDNDVYC